MNVIELDFVSPQNVTILSDFLFVFHVCFPVCFA